MAVGYLKFVGGVDFGICRHRVSWTRPPHRRKARPSPTQQQEPTRGAFSPTMRIRIRSDRRWAGRPDRTFRPRRVRRPMSATAAMAPPSGPAWLLGPQDPADWTGRPALVCPPARDNEPTATGTIAPRPTRLRRRRLPHLGPPLSQSAGSWPTRSWARRSWPTDRDWGRFWPPRRSRRSRPRPHSGGRTTSAVLR